MSKHNFSEKSFILILSNIIISILGLLFSISLSKQLGPEGMGLYGLVRPLNRIFLCITCAGLATAISKVSAEYYSVGDYKNFKRTIKTLMSFTFLWTMFISTLVFIFSPILSKYLIKDIRTINSLRLICPTMVFISLSSCLKGYFFSTFKIKIPLLINIFEKSIEIFILIVVINSLKLTNVTDTVTVAYFTVFIGEFTSFIFLYLYYKINIKKLSTSSNKGENRAQLFYNVISISFPILLAQLISSILSTYSTLIVPRRLVSSGFSYKTALSMIGKFNGMAKNIVFLPMVIINSISVLLIPDLSTSLSRKDYKSVSKRISKFIEISFLLGSVTFILALCIGNNLGLMLYRRKDLAHYIKSISVSAPIFYTSAATTTILNGLGKQKIFLRNSTIVSILKIILLYIFTSIPSINIYGYAITLFITSLISLILNMWEIRKVVFLTLTFFDLIVDILLITLTYFILLLLLKIMPINMMIFSNTLIITLAFLIIFSLKSTLKAHESK